MQTKLIKATDSNINETALLAGEILRNGGIVAIPTETVYGLAANALSGEAVKKIFEAKGRPQDNPLIVHVTDISEVTPLVKSIPDEARRLAERFWPGASHHDNAEERPHSRRDIGRAFDRGCALPVTPRGKGDNKGGGSSACRAERKCFGQTESHKRKIRF